MSKGKASVPQKRTMNLYYKPDRTTKPATVALYVLFVLTVLLGLSKVLVYDLWVEVEDARTALTAAQSRLEGVMAELTDYDEVEERYFRYAATPEEQALVDRMEVLLLLDTAIGPGTALNSVSISGDVVQLRFSGVTLAQTARIVSTLESSPLVAGTTVTTASTTQDEGSLVLATVHIQLQKEVTGQ